MPVYQYTGYRRDGGRAAGIVDAESPRSARLKLRQSGVFPTDVRDQGQTEQAHNAAAPSLFRFAGGAALSVHEVAVVTRQLGTLLAAGLPLVDALGVLLDQAEATDAKRVLADLREQIRGGRAFSAALASYPKEFSPLYVHMVRAGETSGALEQILFRLAEFLEKQEALKTRVTNAVMYPVLMLIVGVGVLFFLMTFVVPKITAVFVTMKQALPAPTVLLMAISRVLSASWVGLLVGAFAVTVGVRRFVSTPRGRLMADRLILRLPLIGDMARKVAISRLAGTLATMLGSGVQLLAALDIAKRVMSNRVLEAAVEHARQTIREGEAIAAPLKRSGEFPSLVTHMIAVGERSGDMEGMLARIAHIYDGEVDRVMTRFTSLLEPAMILLMGGVVFFIVVAILLPIFEMGQMVK